MRDLIKLVSSAKTGHYYTTDKNKRTMPDKMEIKKFDPVVRKHVVYKEAKIKLHHSGIYLLFPESIKPDFSAENSGFLMPA